MRAIDGDALMAKLGIGQDCSICKHDDTPYCCWKPDVVDVCEAICDAHTIEPEPHWIPCSERMPKKNGFYLCTTKDCITILEFIEGNPHYHEEPSFVSDVLGKCNSYVVAWMPLPEPYREGADE